MSAPFGKDGGPVNSVSRNSFDLSYQNSLTMNFGGIYPCFVGEVLPGDSFKIDTTFGLRFMPTAFPLQTRMRADIHYFYVRKRALWPDWQDQYSMKSYATPVKKQLVPPYISPKNARNRDMFATGGLADYLGVPTTLVGKYGNFVNLDPVPANPGPFRVKGDIPASYFPMTGRNILGTNEVVPLDSSFAGTTDGKYGIEFHYYQPSRTGTFKLSIPVDPVSVGSLKMVPRYVIFGYGTGIDAEHMNLYSCPVEVDTEVNFSNLTDMGVKWINSLTISSFGSKSSGSPNDFDIEVDLNTQCFISVGIAYSGIGLDKAGFNRSFPVSIDGASDDTVRDIIDVFGDIVIPWEEKPINADLFRAYEMIYNAFYRDERNNPFVVDGEVQYNKFLPTTDGGEDTNIYKLRYRNWEQDFLTTAVPTPQMGEAPLVGITARGEMSIQDPESGQIYKVMAKTADDADTIVGVDVTETLPHTVMRSLVNYASSGISINDFRNVNAFQRWLETNIRKGFKYKDQIKAHYDVDIRFDELNMPEFIGGASIDILPTTVTQTSQDSEENPLGSYAGQLYGSGSSQHPVTQYCDEHGYIIGLVSVVPVPNYSQLMPKHFWKKESLDYFTPEFGHIGLQPIPAREVCPNQLAQDPNANFETDVFGYQRAHYDYLQRVDEVHGQFRHTLRNFVMNRVFDSKPELGPSFTVIDPTHLNDVFTVQSVNGELIDKILGQIYFKVSAKRPIPKFGIPRLE